MISIIQDSEFMTNLIPANPIPAGKRFKAFQDQNANPAIFSLGEDAVLNLIITENVTPVQVAPVQEDFGQICKFSGAVKAFDLLQNSDMSLSIVVATDAGNNLCNLYILNNIMPSDLLQPDPTKILTAGSTYPLVYDIFLVGDFKGQTSSLKLTDTEQFLADDRPSDVPTDVSVHESSRICYAIKPAWLSRHFC